MLDWLLHKLHIAGTNVLVTYAGLALGAFSFACTTFGLGELQVHLPVLHKVCALGLFVGFFLTAIGKGAAERRTTPRSDNGSGLDKG